MSLSRNTLRCTRPIAVSRDGILSSNDKTEVQYSTYNDVMGSVTRRMRHSEGLHRRPHVFHAQFRH